MIIVFFHVLYMIGKMVYDSLHSNKRKDLNDDTGDGDTEKPANFLNKRHATDPFAEENYDEPNSPRFSPPAYIQRYIAVQNVLADPRFKGKIKKVVDFGCSELGFLNHLKNTAGIEEILCVDVDKETLERHKFKAIPLSADYLIKRPNPLTIRVCEGSVTERDNILANSDAVVAIELIEHLYPDTLMDLPHNIFGYIKPLVVALTTPNSEFNVLFNFVDNQMRHWDHKFEWTRQQFEDWSNNIVSRYPEYQVSFQGIGSGPEGTEHLGCCSQMAVFTRSREPESLPIYGIEGLFKLVLSQEYPYRVDNRSDEEKVLDEVSYYIRRFTQINSECLEEYPLAQLLRNLEQFNISEEMLREILQNGGYTVVDNDENGAAIMCPALSTFSDYAEDLDDVGDGFPDEWESQQDENAADDMETVFANECWDDYYEIPAQNSSVREEEEELSLTRSLDTAEFNTIEISNVSHVPSVPDSIEPEVLGNFLESFESIESNRLAEIPISIEVNSLPIQNSSVDSNSSSVFAIAEKDENRFPGIDDTIELGSLCSIYLESSRNDERHICPVNITNPSFDCTPLEYSSEESKDPIEPILSASVADDRFDSELHGIHERLTSDAESSSQPQFTSSPRIALKLEANAKKSESEEFVVRRLESVSQTSLRSNESISTTKKSESVVFRLESVSQTSLRSNESTSTTTTSSGSSLSTLRKWYPPEENSVYREIDEVKLKGGNEITDEPTEETTSENGEVDSSESHESIERVDGVTRLRQNAPESLSLESTTSSKTTLSKLNTSVGLKSIERVESRTEKSNPGKSDYESSRSVETTNENTDRKSATPEAPETPPNSWSPEIMDSGYPNTSSIQDTTPEYELPSIAQDEMSDRESPSIDEPPRIGFLEHADVENGDLANNNRDYEGNNMIAPENNIDDDLQPLIDVLEDDIENENDIYAIENDFPVWLLGILRRGNNNVAAAAAAAAGRLAARDEPDDDPREVDVHAAGDAGLPDFDEGFDSTSSEYDHIDDAPSVTMESSDASSVTTETSEDANYANDTNASDFDLQPLIDVLEDDIENENDIYAIENDFPVWLLGILRRGNNNVAAAAAAGRLAARDEPDDDPREVNVQAAGDAGLPDFDEGFDSTSSEYDHIDDAPLVTMESSDASSVTTETSEDANYANDTNASGDYY